MAKFGKTITTIPACRNLISKFFATVLLTAVLHIVAAHPVSAVVLRYFPNANNPSGQISQLDTSLVTGGAEYDYQLKVPPGTNGLTPQLSLHYSSLSAKQNSILGSGWQLSQNYIERDVNLTPDNTNDDKYLLYLNGSGHELVYNSTTGRYHTKVESYLWIKKLTGGSNSFNEYWLIK